VESAEPAESGLSNQSGEDSRSYRSSPAMSVTAEMGFAESTISYEMDSAESTIA
jgi:hypothetical protein